MIKGQVNCYLICNKRTDSLRIRKSKAIPRDNSKRYFGGYKVQFFKLLRGKVSVSDGSKLKIKKSWITTWLERYSETRTWSQLQSLAHPSVMNIKQITQMSVSISSVSQVAKLSTSWIHKIINMLETKTQFCFWLGVSGWFAATKRINKEGNIYTFGKSSLVSVIQSTFWSIWMIIGKSRNSLLSSSIDILRLIAWIPLVFVYSDSNTLTFSTRTGTLCFL